MPLLTYAIARHPGATGDLLRVVTDHIRAGDQGARAALLAHPALPDNLTVPDPSNLVQPDDPTSYLDQVTLDTVLRLPHTTPATRDRLLSAVPTWALGMYVSDNPDVPDGVLAYLAEHLPAETGSHTRMLDVLHHPALTADVEVVALHAHLALLTTDPAYIAQDDDLAYAITRATAHPARLDDLTASVPGDHHARPQMQRYVDIATAGDDPYAARIADIRDRVHDIERPDHLEWADVIAYTGDPALALEALDATPPIASSSRSVVSAVLQLHRLRYTTAAYRAQLRRSGRPERPPLPATPTDADLLRAARPAHRDNPGARFDPTETIGSAVAYGLGRAHLTSDLLDPMVEEIATSDTRPGYGPPPRGILWHATVMALHPGLTDEQRRILTDRMGELIDTAHADGRPRDLRGDPSLVVHTLATVADPAVTILTLPVAALTHAATYSSRIADDLCAILAPIVAEHARDTGVAHAMLALEDGFPGTLAELLATAHTITT